MNVDNLNDEFENWNPMEKDSGPGAVLDSALQPGQLALQKAAGNHHAKEDAPPPFLVFKNMPENMTRSALNNICSRHGQVKAVRDSKKNNFYFVDLASVADMEAVYRALENNTHGFKVFLGKHFNKNLKDTERNMRDQDIPVITPRSVGSDYQNLTYRASINQHPRPSRQENDIVINNNNSILPLNLLAVDVHSLEREDLHKVKSNNKFIFQNGHSYVTIPEKTKEFIKKKNSESLGRCSPSKDSSAISMDGIEKPKLSKCSQCEFDCHTVCSRCSLYYCSVKCQKNDWQQHRYICGKPKHLQRTPPPKVSITSKLAIEQKNNDPSTSLNHPNHISPKTTENSPATKNNLYKQQMPRSGNIVTITAIFKTNLVFIRSKTYEDNMSYFKTKDSLQAIGKKLKPLKTLPQCGKVVIAKFEEQFSRAIVLNTNNPKAICVNYMDIGSKEYLNLDELYEAPEEFVDTPRHAIPVVLKDVPNYTTEEIRNFMYTYLDHISVYIKYTTDDFIDVHNVYAVELIDETTQQNLNNMIIKLARANIV